MPLVIDSPDIEDRLQQQAARRGVTVAEYAVTLLVSDLDEAEAEQNASNVSSYAPSTPQAWAVAFDRWVESHPVRAALPEDAFDRASFYSERS